jgi:hypothetical protein
MCKSCSDICWSWLELSGWTTSQMTGLFKPLAWVRHEAVIHMKRSQTGCQQRATHIITIIALRLCHTIMEPDTATLDI